MSKENVIKFYNEVKKNEKLKTEFEVLQNKLQKTTQFKDFNILAKEIVHIGKKYNFDFSEKELNSYLEELKNNLTDEELLTISGGLSPKIAAMGLLGILGISAITSTAMRASQFASKSHNPTSESVASLENEDNESNTGGTDNFDATDDSAYYENDNDTNYDSPVNPTYVNKNSKQNLLKSLFATKTTPGSINTSVPSLRASTPSQNDNEGYSSVLEQGDEADSINVLEERKMQGGIGEGLNGGENGKGDSRHKKNKKRSKTKKVEEHRDEANSGIGKVDYNDFGDFNFEEMVESKTEVKKTTGVNFTNGRVAIWLKPGVEDLTINEDVLKHLQDECKIDNLSEIKKIVLIDADESFHAYLFFSEEARAMLTGYKWNDEEEGEGKKKGEDVDLLAGLKVNDEEEGEGNRDDEFFRGERKNPSGYSSDDEEDGPLAGFKVNGEEEGEDKKEGEEEKKDVDFFAGLKVNGEEESESEIEKIDRVIYTGNEVVIYLKSGENSLTIGKDVLIFLKNKHGINDLAKIKNIGIIINRDNSLFGPDLVSPTFSEEAHAMLTGYEWGNTGSSGKRKAPLKSLKLDENTTGKENESPSGYSSDDEEDGPLAGFKVNGEEEGEDKKEGEEEKKDVDFFAGLKVNGEEESESEIEKIDRVIYTGNEVVIYLKSGENSLTIGKDVLIFLKNKHGINDLAKIKNIGIIINRDNSLFGPDLVSPTFSEEAKDMLTGYEWDNTSQGIFDQDNTTLDAVQSMFLDSEEEAENIAKIKNVENKGSGWVYVSLKDGEDSFTISRGSLQYLANITSMNVNDIKYIWVNEGQVAPTLSNDIREIFSEPSDVQWRALEGVYQNAVKRFTEEETKAKETEEINKLMTADNGYNEDQIARNLADINVKSAKKDSSWLMLTLENKDKGVNITKENLSTLARVAGFENADEVQYIQVENGDISPTLGADLQETFSKPGTVTGWFGRKYINTMHRLSADEIKNQKIQTLVNLKVEEEVAKFIVDNDIDVRNPDGNLNDNELEIAKIMYREGVDEITAKLMCDGGIDKEVAKFIVDNDIAVRKPDGDLDDDNFAIAKIMYYKDVDEITAKLMYDSNIDKEIAKFIVDNDINVRKPDGTLNRYELEIAEIMYINSVNKNIAKLLYDGVHKEVAIIMIDRGVDKDTAKEINKIANATSSYTGQWVYVTLKDGETSLKINQNTLKYLAEMAEFNEEDDVKAIQINNGNVIPEISDDLKYKFTIEDYSSSYKNVAMCLKENEIRNDNLDKCGIKKLRFNKSKNVVYITMKEDTTTLSISQEVTDFKGSLLNYIKELTKMDIKTIYVGMNESDFEKGGNDEIEIDISGTKYKGKKDFSIGNDLVNEQAQKIENVDNNQGDVTVTLNTKMDRFKVNQEMISYLQKKAGMVGWFSTTPLKSLTVKFGKNKVNIELEPSVKDKYKLESTVKLKAKD